MLRIHKSQSRKKLFFLVITSICGIGALLGFSVLTYTPELSHAEVNTYSPNPVIHPNLNDITYMQEITKDVCSNTVEDYTKQLIDKRDNKSYWITKFKDGNCWMTQNLALDLWIYDNESDLTGHGRVLTPVDSNVVTNWTSDSGASAIWEETSYNIVRYYNPGDWLCKNNTCVKVNDSASTSKNDYHLLMGNYYSWGAATANQAENVSAGGETTQSICPKGWHLPRGGQTDDNEFIGLLSKYYDYINGMFNSIYVYNPPFYFIRSGSIYNQQWTAGRTGYYWTSTAGTNSFAFTMRVFETMAYPAIPYETRSQGKSVRCLAEGKIKNRQDNVEIMVASQLSLDIANEVVAEKSEVNPSTVNLDVKVSSNQKYSVGISVEDSNLTSTTSEVKIPAKSGLLNTADNGWGIKLKGDTEFTALTTDLQTFYTASGAEIKTIPFTIGISTVTDLPNGEYSTSITVTATQN